jgi:molybdopterin/thiamine biosynthesis adenylyltransferase
MNRREYYKRANGLIDPAHLQSRRVAVVGVGSGGSRVAAELGRLGVSLLLIERPGERLQEHNLIRHLLDYRSLGKLKLAETARYLRFLNPSTRVKTSALDVVGQRDQCAQLLQRWKPDLLAVCTDNEPSKHAINEVAVRLRLIQCGAGVYDGGIGGEVYWSQPGGACYGCIAAQLHPERQSLPTTANIPEADESDTLAGEDPQQGNVDVEAYSGRSEEGRSTCALNLDIQQIALLHARICVDLILEEHAGKIGIPADANLCVFANRVVAGTFDQPWQAMFHHLPRREDCLCCGATPKGIEAAAAEILRSLSSSRPRSLSGFSARKVQQGEVPSKGA